MSSKQRIFINKINMQANHFCLFISLYKPLLYSKSYKQLFLWYIILVVHTLYDFSKATVLCMKCQELTKNSEMYLGIYRYIVIFVRKRKAFYSWNKRHSIVHVSSLLNMTEHSIWGVQVQQMASQGQELFKAFLAHKYYSYYPQE